MAENNSIFEFAEKFGYESPFDDWVEENNKNRKEIDVKRAEYDHQVRTLDSKQNIDIVNGIIEYSKKIELWQSIGSGFKHWKNKGLSDVKLSKYKIEFGATKDNMRSEMVADDVGPFSIIFNEKFVDKYTIPSFSQMLFMELGNVKNWKQLNKIFEGVKKYTREEFVRAIETLEFNIRIEIIMAYLKGQFDSSIYAKQECIFNTKILDFENYYNSPELLKHKEVYGKFWDEETANNK